ncbi:MAG: HDOD domain-containing protein [Pseudomonadota bacterium]
MSRPGESRPPELAGGAETTLPEGPVLRQYTPLNDLTDAALHDLRAHLRVVELKAGGFLFKAGDLDDWSFFLLDGRLSVDSGSGAPTTLEAGSPTSFCALSPPRPRLDTVRAVETCRILRAPSSLLEMLMTPDGAQDGFELDEIDEEDTHLEDRLLFQILSDYRSDSITIPSLPEVISRIRRTVEGGDSGFDSAALMVSLDPAVAARLVQLANGPAAGGGDPVGSVRDAVSRIGIDKTREVVAELALNNLMPSDHPELKKRMRALWEHSVWVASISYQLALKTGAVNPDLAQLGGLTHDLGAMALVAHAPRYPDLMNDPAALVAMLEQLRGPVGAIILRQWKFPDALVTVALEADEWHRTGGDRADCCDVVLVAQLLSHMGKPTAARLPKAPTVPSFARLDLGTADATMEVLRAAAKSMRSMQKLLKEASPSASSDAVSTAVAAS